VRRILGNARSQMSIWVTASVARCHKVRILGAKFGAPLLVREQTWNVDPEGSVQYGESVYLGDRFRTAVEFASAPQSGGAGV
jgi:DNA-binding GntR family transcriptional regulator